MALVHSVKDGIFSGIAAVERLVSNRSAKLPLHSIRHFLLPQYPRALGSAVHATALIPALRSAVPDCRIAVAASGVAVEIFRGNPGIDHLLVTPNPLDDFLGSVSSLRRQNPFRGSDYAVLSSIGNQRTRVAMQFVLSGGSLRIGLTHAPQLFRVPFGKDRSLSQIASNLRILSALATPPSPLSRKFSSAQRNSPRPGRFSLAAGFSRRRP